MTPQSPRGLMAQRRSSGRAIVAGTVILALAACQSPVVPPPAPPPSRVTHNPAPEARLAVAQRDCDRAAPLLREAIGFDPRNVELHYDLAVCLTHLNLQDEAVREFRWLLAHASSGSHEARTARSWLAEAGQLGQASRAVARPASGHGGATAGLAGVAVWGEGREVPRALPRLLLHLIGVPGTPTEGQYYRVRTDKHGRFELTNVVAGPYKLTNRLAGPPIWRLKVELVPGHQVSVSLTPDNSVRVRDDFPEPTG